jgi:hypothetical protein
VAGSCGDGNDTSGSVKDDEIFNQLRDLCS